VTPAARLSAAIEVLDQILAGQPVDPSLVAWARGHRFAGSGDRHAIRDLVFDALRCRRSFAALGGGETGRGLILGLARWRGEEALFGSPGHAPAAVGTEDTGHPPDGLAALDCPDWLAPSLQAALGPDFTPVMQALQKRAPVFLRVNLGKSTLPAAQATLAAEGIETEPVAGVRTALQVTTNARKIKDSAAYAQGLVELQDLSSQDLCLTLPLFPGARVLDYCAGGGGKTLALAALAEMTLFAHDAAPQRLKDLAPRATRAGAKVTLTRTPGALAPFDLVLTDVPCSGSGSWRRDPIGKWALTPQRLGAVCATQAGILDEVAPMVAPRGVLAHATCSLLIEENEAQIAEFLTRHPGWTCTLQRRWSPLSGGDGFFLALLTPPSGRPTQP
jgi:16S rRNA (cytosine967-C5)-methyltransferase